MTLGSLVKDGLDLTSIRVNSVTTIVANNCSESGGSVTSELAAMAVQVVTENCFDTFWLEIVYVTQKRTSCNTEKIWKDCNNVGCAAMSDIILEPYIAHSRPKISDLISVVHEG